MTDVGELLCEIERLRADIDLLRHAADLNAESLAEQTERADHLQALIDDYAEAMQAVKGATLSNVHQLHDVLEVRANALLAAATPKEDDRERSDVPS